MTAVLKYAHMQKVKSRYWSLQLIDVASHLAHRNGTKKWVPSTGRLLDL